MRHANQRPVEEVYSMSMSRSRCSRLMYLVVDCAILSQDDTSRWRARASWRRLCGSEPAAQRFSGRLGVWGTGLRRRWLCSPGLRARQPAVWGRQAHPLLHQPAIRPILLPTRCAHIPLLLCCLRLTLRLKHVENRCSAAAGLQISTGRVRFGQRRRWQRLWQQVRSSFCGCWSGWGRRSAPRPPYLGKCPVTPLTRSSPILAL